MNDIKIFAVADTHRRLKRELERLVEKRKEECDVVVTLGDIPCEGLWCISPDFGVLGNHDNFGLLGDWDIHGKLVEKNGVSFAGFQGSSRYKDGPFPLYTQEESLKLDIPKADVLISHDRIYKPIMDKAHTGLMGITQYLDMYKPFLHLHGHHHKQEVYKYNETIVVSVYECAIITVKNNQVSVEHLF